jgi:hypothetical protein
MKSLGTTESEQTLRPTPQLISVEGVLTIEQAKETCY